MSHNSHLGIRPHFTWLSQDWPLPHSATPASLPLRQETKTRPFTRSQQQTNKTDSSTQTPSLHHNKEIQHGSTWCKIYGRTGGRDATKPLCFIQKPLSRKLGLKMSLSRAAEKRHRGQKKNGAKTPGKLPSRCLITCCIKDCLGWEPIPAAWR